MDGDCRHKIKRCLLLGRKAMTDLDILLKSRDITLPTKAHIIKALIFPVVLYRCESCTVKKGWVPKKWCFWLVVLKKTLESPLDSNEVKLVNPKGNQPWTFIGRTEAEAEAPIHWPPDALSWYIGKDPDTGKDWGQEEKGMTQDKMAGWHQQLNGHEFRQGPGDRKGQGNLACCSPCGHKESDMT